MKVCPKCGGDVDETGECEPCSSAQDIGLKQTDVQVVDTPGARIGRVLFVMLVLGLIAGVVFLSDKIIAWIKLLF